MTSTRFIKSPIVTVVVGKGHQAQSFPIYRDLLTAHSPYFAACLKDEWTEGQENHVKLEEESPKAFEVMVNWLFGDPDSMKSINMLDRHEIIQAYKLARYLQMTQLKNDLVDHLRSCYMIDDMIPTLSMLDEIGCAGKTGSLLYQLCIKMYVWYYHNSNDLDELLLHNESSTTFCNGDLTCELLGLIHEYPHIKWSDPRKETGCVYHDHSDGSACRAV